MNIDYQLYGLRDYDVHQLEFITMNGRKLAMEKPIGEMVANGELKNKMVLRLVRKSKGA